MAVDDAPRIFEATIEDLAPDDTIIDETSAWSSVHTNEGMESRLGDGLLDPRRNGKAYIAHEIRPNTVSGPTNFQYGLRFFQYDLATQAVDHISYVKDIVRQSTSTDDFRGPGLAVEKSSGKIWAMYYESTDDEDEPLFGGSDELFVKSSTDSGQTWSSETTVVTLSGNDQFAGDDYQRPQISIGDGGTGYMLYCVYDTSTNSASFRTRTLSGSTWGSETTINTVASVSDKTLCVHSISVDKDGNALAVVYNGTNAGEHEYAYYVNTGSGFSSIGARIVDTPSQRIRLHTLKANNHITDLVHWVSLYAESDGGTFVRFVDTTTVYADREISDHAEIPSANGSDGDDVALEFDLDGAMFLMVGGNSTSKSALTYAKFTYTALSDDLSSPDETDGLNFWNNVGGNDGYFEDAQAEYPQRFYRTVTALVYDRDLHVVLMARRYPTGSLNYMTVWEILANDVAAMEVAEEVSINEGEGGFLWIQSKADSRDSVMVGTAITAQDIATLAELHPVYGEDRTRSQRFMRLLLRYTNWGEADLTLSWYGDNRVSSSRTVTLNPAGFPTSLTGPAAGGAFLSPPGDYQAQKTVALRTGGSRIFFSLSASRGRYSLREAILVLQPSRRRVSSQILPYNQPHEKWQ